MICVRCSVSKYGYRVLAGEPCAIRVHDEVRRGRLVGWWMRSDGVCMFLACEGVGRRTNFSFSLLRCISSDAECTASAALQSQRPDAVAVWDTAALEAEGSRHLLLISYV